MISSLKEGIVAGIYNPTVPEYFKSEIVNVSVEIARKAKNDLVLGHCTESTIT